MAQNFLKIGQIYFWGVPGAVREGPEAFFLRFEAQTRYNVDVWSIFRPADPHEVSRLSAKTGVWLCALHFESLVQRNLEKPRKLIRKSTRNREHSRLGAARALGWVDFWRSGKLG